MTARTGPKLRAPGGLLFVGMLSVVVALFPAGIAAYSGIRSALLVSGTEAAEGVVVGTRPSTKTTVPIIDFTTKAGTPARFEGSIARPVGERVPVLYDPRNPSRATVDSFVELWMLAIILGVLGGVMLLFGAPMLAFAARRASARKRAQQAGLHLPGTVVAAQAVGVLFNPIVEAHDPASGAPAHYVAERQRHAPVPGSPAVVHVDPKPPHGYFVELR